MVKYISLKLDNNIILLGPVLTYELMEKTYKVHRFSQLTKASDSLYNLKCIKEIFTSCHKLEQMSNLKVKSLKRLQTYCKANQDKVSLYFECKHSRFFDCTAGKFS